MPVFLMMVLGYLLHWKTPLLNDDFADCLNTFVLKIAMPAQLFKSLSAEDFYAVWDGGMVFFCFAVSLLSILLLLGLSLLLQDRTLRAEFVQAGYRGSQALLGLALLQNIYGSDCGGGPLALVLIGAVPLYNVAAVLLLTLLVPGGHLDRWTMEKAIRGIVTNPIILGIAVGLAWSLLGLPQPVVFQRLVSSLAATTTPLGLLALGACIDLKKAAGCWKPTAVASLFKLVIFAGAFLPLAVLLGYRGEALTALLIMLASPTTVNGFSMARSMGHEGALTASAVMLTTVCSAFTFTVWLYLLKILALI